MDISEKPETTVKELVGKLQGTTMNNAGKLNAPISDRMAKPQAGFADVVETPQTAVADMVETPQAAVADMVETPQAGVADMVESPQAGIADMVESPQAGVADMVESPQAAIADMVESPQAAVADMVETPQAAVADMVETPQAAVADMVKTPPAVITDRMADMVETPQAAVADMVKTPPAVITDRMAKPQVSVHQGRLEGITLKTDSGFSYNAFLGVPYAKPPIGNLRFKEPQPADHWEGVREAKLEGNESAQIDFLTNALKGKEDCLYLNIFVPEESTIDSELPVMFWIHGGGFNSGSGSREIYGPEHLVDKHVILVTINYRLGPLGFLCLNTTDCPGNAGLKDQVMALKWVNDNISKFGGNPKNITIFGESAGSISAYYITMSPTAKGLFSKAIFQSGTSSCDLLSKSDPVASAITLAELLGFKNSSNKNMNDLLRFLTNVQYDKMVTASKDPAFGKGDKVTFAPVVEKPFPPKKAFITENPSDLLKAGKYNKVPTMFGYTSNEGVLFAPVFTAMGIDLKTATLEQLIPNFQDYIPVELKERLNSAKRYVAANKIKEFYFASEEGLLDKFFNFMSDYSMVKDTDYSVKMFSKFVSTYYYRFSFAGELNIMKLLLKFPYFGAAHADELCYLFKPYMQELQIEPTARDTVVINCMTEMWTNFAKTGNPTPALSGNIKTIWKPVNKKEIYCYDINDECSLIQNPYQERVKFWEDLNNTE